jgi:subtilisin family serine protease
MKNYFILATLLFTTHLAFGAEFILRAPTGMHANAIDFSGMRASSFNALGKNYLKIAVPQAREKEFKKMMADKYQNWIYEPNVSYTIFDYRPSEPDFSKQWGLENQGHNEPLSNGQMSPVTGVVGADIGALKAWSYTTGDKKIIVAVIDTGIDYNHPDLKQNLWINQSEADGKPGVDDDGNGYIDDIYGYDVSNNDADPMDDNKHGTHVAGVIGAAHNGIGSVGVMAQVSLMAVKFTDAKGRGDLERALKGINYAYINHAKIMSNSWGNKIYSKLLEDAISEANKAGTVFVAAAGNFGANNNDVDPIYPASYKVENVISVGAMSADEYPSSFSCFGPNSVHISAPGTNIYSTIPGGSYAVLSGTSQATPFVSGIAGLALSLKRDLTPVQLKNLMIGTATYIQRFSEKNIAKGRINAGSLLEKIKSL